MARMSDKEFSIRHQLVQLRRDRNRLERIKERTDNDFAETRVAIKSLKSSLVEIEMEKKAALIASLKKSKKKAPVKKKAAAPKKKVSDIVAPIEKNKKTFEAEEPEELTDAEAVHVPEEKISDVKVDASSMTAVEDSAEHSVELKDKKPPEKKTTTKAKESDEDTNSE